MPNVRQTALQFCGHDSASDPTYCIPPRCRGASYACRLHQNSRRWDAASWRMFYTRSASSCCAPTTHCGGHRSSACARCTNNLCIRHGDSAKCLCVACWRRLGNTLRYDATLRCGATLRCRAALRRYATNCLVGLLDTASRSRACRQLRTRRFCQSVQSSWSASGKAVGHTR